MCDLLIVMKDIRLTVSALNSALVRRATADLCNVIRLIPKTTPTEKHRHQSVRQNAEECVLNGLSGIKDREHRPDDQEAGDDHLRDSQVHVVSPAI